MCDKKVYSLLGKLVVYKKERISHLQKWYMCLFDQNSSDLKMDLFGVISFFTRRVTLREILDWQPTNISWGSF